MEKSTLKSYNDLFKETDGNTAKFYVLYNTNLTYLLTANEIVTFYQIVHVCNINRNYASLNYLKNLLNMSLNTIKKSIEKLILLKLIERNKNYNSTFFYTLNLESIEYIYNNVNSCHKLEERKAFCKQYIEDCIKESTTVPESAISKIDTPTISKNDTHISNMFIKKDEFHNKNKFNNENESHNKDVEVGEQANAETLNETANANSSFNVNSTNVGNDMNFETYFDRIKTAFNTDDITTLTEFEDMFSSKETFDNLSKEDINELKFYASDAKQRLQRKLNIDKPADADNSNEMANADSNDENKALVSIENEKTTDCSNDRKSFNREPENDVIVDSNDVVTIDETALAKDYYQRVLYTESLEELESLSNEIKQLPMKESYIEELLQLIETTGEQFNEDSEDASGFDLNEALNNNPIFARVYNTVLASLSKFNLGTLVAYKEQLQSGDLKELSQQEKLELQNLVENSIIKLQERYSNIA